MTIDASQLPQIHFAPGVKLDKLTPQTLYAMTCAAVVCCERGVPCKVSSLYRPGIFAAVGFHGDGNAVDFAMRDVDPVVGDIICSQLDGWIGRRGGGQYDVVNEIRPGTSKGWTGPHIHIEFDP